MRQTGRTSRIADFAVDQLFSIGEVIVTDHSVFEYPDSNTRSSIEHLCKMVTDRMERSSYGTTKVDCNIKKLDGTYVIHFKAYKKK